MISMAKVVRKSPLRAEHFKKHGSIATVDKTASESLTKTVDFYTDKKGEVYAHHDLRRRQAAGELKAETAHAESLRIFTEKYNKEAAPHLVEAANHAFEGRFTDAQRTLVDLKQKGMLSEQERLNIWQQIHPEAGEGGRIREGTGSKTMSVNIHRAEELIRSGAERFPWESFGVTESAKQTEVLDELDREYKSGQGELHDLVESVRTDSLQEENRMAYSFTRKISGSMNDGALDIAINRILKKKGWI